MLTALLVFGAILLLFLTSFVYVRETEVGVVTKRYGKSLPDGRMIALNGEAGFQADPLPPGYHFFKWSFIYKVDKIPVIKVEQGKLALIVAEDGDQMPNERILGKIVDCDNFQNARKFLMNGGQKGRQIGYLTAGIHRINTALFTVITEDNCEEYGLSKNALRVINIASDKIGVVTVNDGRPLPVGKISSSSNLADHHSFQDAQKFMDNGGYKGLQVEVILAGSYNLNPWFASVEISEMTDVPLAKVAVVTSSSGDNEKDVSGESFTHGNLVEKGGRGIWSEPLLPGKHPLNPKLISVQEVPTSNTVLNWANEESASHKLDQNLSSINVRSKDGFQFTIDVSQIIHIAANNAPKVISRVGSMQNLIENVLAPIIGNYFRNAAQNYEMLDFVQRRAEIQKEAAKFIKEALGEYNVVGVDTLIGDLTPPEELMKTLTDRKVATEKQETYKAQELTEKQRQSFQKETALADEQKRIVSSQQSVLVATNEANAMIEKTKGEAQSMKLKAEAEASSTKLNAEAEADKITRIGKSTADTYQLKVNAMGKENYTSMEVMKALAENKIKMVPDVVAGSSDGGSGLLNAFVAKTMLSHKSEEPKEADKKEEKKA